MEFPYVDSIDERNGVQRAQNWEQSPIDFAHQLLFTRLNIVEEFRVGILLFRMPGVLNLLILQLFCVLGIHLGFHVDGGRKKQAACGFPFKIGGTGKERVTFSGCSVNLLQTEVGRRDVEILSTGGPVEQNKHTKYSPGLFFV